MRMGAPLKKDLPTLALDFAPQPKYLVLQFQIVFAVRIPQEELDEIFSLATLFDYLINATYERTTNYVLYVFESRTERPPPLFP